MSNQAFYLNAEVSLRVVTCPTCFVVYAVPDELLLRKNREGGNWYCPNGHNLSYKKTQIAELEEKLKKEKETSEFWRKRTDNLHFQNLELKKQNSAKKGVITKMKKRAGENKL